MISLEGFALLRPFWLLLPVLLAALVYLTRLRGGLGDWRPAIDASLLRVLDARGAVAGAVSRRRWTLAAVAAAVTALALSGPAVQRATSDAYRNLDGLIVAFDLSRSMVEGGSLPEARIAAMQSIALAGSRQAGLVAYAGDAYVVAPFTADRAALGQLVSALGPGLVPESGSDAARAIRLALTRFEEAGILAGDLVLVGDGGGFGPDSLAAAAALRAAGHRLHVLFIHPSSPPDGLPEADRAAAEAMAAAGGGVVADAIDPARLAAVLGETVSARLARSDYAVLGWLDLGRALLVPAALALLLLFRRTD